MEETRHGRCNRRPVPRLPTQPQFAGPVRSDAVYRELQPARTSPACGPATPQPSRGAPDPARRLRGHRLDRAGGWSSPGPRPGPVVDRAARGPPAFGVRFRVGAAGAALGLPAAELLDADGAARGRLGRRRGDRGGGRERRRCTCSPQTVTARIGAARPTALVRAAAHRRATRASATASSAAASRTPSATARRRSSGSCASSASSCSRAPPGAPRAARARRRLRRPGAPHARVHAARRAAARRAAGRPAPGPPARGPFRSRRSDPRRHDGGMTVDLQAATDLPPRQRPRCSSATASRTCSTAADPEPVVQALRAYRNPDGGFGNAIEPDMRAPDSQPVGIHTVMEILDEVGVRDDPMIARRRRLARQRSRAPTAASRSACRARSTTRAARGGSRPTSPRSPRPPPTPPRCTRSASSHPWLDGADEFLWRWLDELDLATAERGPRHRLRRALRGHRSSTPIPTPRAPRPRSTRSRPHPRPARSPPSPSGDVQTPLDLAPLPGLPRPPPVRPGDDRRAPRGARPRRSSDDGGWTLGCGPSGTRRPTLEWRGVVTVNALRLLRANCEDWPSGGLRDAAGFGEHRTMRRSCIRAARSRHRSPPRSPSASRPDRLLRP